MAKTTAGITMAARRARRGFHRMSAASIRAECGAAARPDRRRYARIIRALMDATPISRIGRRSGESALVEGWLYNKRSSGKIQFLIVRDGTGYVQVVVPRAEVAP